jgi:myosin heavy subunit
MTDTEQLTVPIVQKQIDALREQLFKLNEIRNGNIAAATSGARGKRGGKLTNLTAEEHQVIARNEALRAEKAKLERDLAGRDAPEVMDKKNALHEVEKAVQAHQKELERLQQARNTKREEASAMQQRHHELQALQSALVTEATDHRQQLREMQSRIKEAERKLLASHSKVVRLNERSKHGVPAADAKKLSEEVAAQERQIAELEEEVKKRRHAQQQQLMRNKVTRVVSEKEKETAALQEQVTKLQEVLASRDSELRRSYDYAARKCRVTTTTSTTAPNPSVAAAAVVYAVSKRRASNTSGNADA